MSDLIVVGVDGSEPSLKALRWAARQAEITGAGLEAVSAWEYPAGTWASMAAGMPPELDLATLTREVLDEALAKVLEPGALAAVDRKVVTGNAAQVLIERSADAALVVVGDRGHSGFAAALLGSVSTHVTQHAHCPVVVVRGL